MRMYTVSQWMMFFYIYCFLGWIWECCYVSVNEKKLVNRGFLKGPFLPIYGSGALCMLIVTIPVRDNLVLMFLAGMIAPTLLEYVTGAVMERLFRVRYWDYSDKFMNVNGYICLGSTVCWGVMTVILVKFGHQYVEKFVFAIDEAYTIMLVLVITPVLLIDFITSFHAAIHLRDILVQNERLREELHKLSEKLHELEQLVQDTGEKAKEQVAFVKEQALLAKEQVGLVKEQALSAKDQATREMQELMGKMGELKNRLANTYGKSVRGLLKRNPGAVSRWHKESFSELKQSLMEKISRKDESDPADVKDGENV